MFNKKESKLFGDKGYICKEEIRTKLKNKYNVKLVTKSRNNIKNKQYNTLLEEDKQLLKKEIL